MLMNTLLYLKWIDSASVHGWEDIGREHKPRECVSVGYLAHEDEASIQLVSHYSTDYDGKVDQACGRIIIPKCCIVERREIE